MDINLEYVALWNNAIQFKYISHKMALIVEVNLKIHIVFKVGHRLKIYEIGAESP